MGEYLTTTKNVAPDIDEGSSSNKNFNCSTEKMAEVEKIPKDIEKIKFSKM